MALFKISKGSSTALLTGSKSKYAREGSAWFTTDDGKFYIDIAGNGTSDLASIGSNRIPLNANKADYVANSLTIRLNGAIAGTSGFYSYNGSTAPDINITTDSINALNLINGGHVTGSTTIDDLTVGSLLINGTIRLTDSFNIYYKNAFNTQTLAASSIDSNNDILLDLSQLNNNQQLTIRLGGATAGTSGFYTYNGSTAPDINIAPSTIGAAAASHTHGNITNDGKLGTASKIVVTDANSLITTGSIGESDIVTISGTQTISGSKIFTKPVVVESNSETAFNVESTTSGGYLCVTRTNAPDGVPVQMCIRAGINGGTFGTNTNNIFNFRTNNITRMTVGIETKVTDPAVNNNSNNYTYTPITLSTNPPSTSNDTQVATTKWVKDRGYLTSYTEIDPTVPAWAKASSKPAYTASEITGGLTESSNVHDDLLTLNNSKASISHTHIMSEVTDLDLSGYVTGPSSSINNEIPIYDSTTGKIIKKSGILIRNPGTSWDGTHTTPNRAANDPWTSASANNPMISFGNDAAITANSDGAFVFFPNLATTSTASYLVNNTEFRPLSYTKHKVDLGSSSYPWRTIYAGNLTIGGDPDTSAETAKTISSSGDLYIKATGTSDGTIQFFTNGSERARFTSGGAFRPATTNTYSIGNTSYYWKTFYVSGASSANDQNYGINIGSTASIIGHIGSSSGLGLYSAGNLYLRVGNVTGTSGVTLNSTASNAGNLTPSATNAWSLGTASIRWKALYIGTADSYGGPAANGNPGKPIYWDNGVPKAMTLTASDVGALPNNTTYVSSFNGSSGAITYTAPVTSVNTKTGAVVLDASDLGLSNAMHFIGISNSEIINGGNQDPNTGISGYTKTAGDVVLYGNQEFVYGADNKWHLLGDEGSYKIKQTALAETSGTDDGISSTQFIYSIAQNENGEISVKSRTIPTYNNYSHPTGAGNNHIPSGGSNGQVLKNNGNSGTAVWGDNNAAGSTDISTKIFLIGASSQAASAQTYSDNEVFVTNGELQTKAYNVAGQAIWQWDSSLQAVKLTFN